MVEAEVRWWWHWDGDGATGMVKYWESVIAIVMLTPQEGMPQAQKFCMEREIPTAAQTLY